jgi:hypothetical protein
MMAKMVERMLGVIAGKSLEHYVGGRPRALLLH